MPSDCYACRLIEGAAPLPGGRIHVTEHWVVEHCTGPLGVGTMIVKPFRHCLHVGEKGRGHCHTAVVLGAGPVGLLGAMALAAVDFEVYVYSREAAPNPKGAGRPKTA